MQSRFCRTKRFKLSLRQVVAWGLMGSVALFAPVAAQAQAPSTKAGSPEDKTLTTKDNVEIRITYFPGTSGKDSPVVVMLPGKGGSRLIYNNAPQGGVSLAKALQGEGYAVVTVDPRGHGESTGGPGKAGAGKASVKELTARDYQAVVAFDLEAVKKFLLDEHQKQTLNVAKLGLVAADSMTPVIAEYTLLDWSKKPYEDNADPTLRTPRGQDVKALVMLTPDTTAPGMSLTAIGSRLRQLPVAVLLAIGSKDTVNMSTANKLHDVLVPKKQASETVFLEKYDGKFRGTDLLFKRLNPPVEVHLVNFLRKTVKDLNIDWRNRRSELLGD